MRLDASAATIPTPAPTTPTYTSFDSPAAAASSAAAAGDSVDVGQAGNGPRLYAHVMDTSKR
ncbi:hypothetical protein DIE07_18395 [Burkholderia sp. Bp9002]|nr:hypothetical protein DIE07_18395 [Burkholderia sp. Bp9002]